MLPVTTLGRAANAMIDTNCLETPVTRVEDKHQHRRTWLHRRQVTRGAGVGLLGQASVGQVSV